MGNLKEQSLSDCRSFLATQSIKLSTEVTDDEAVVSAMG